MDRNAPIRQLAESFAKDSTLRAQFQQNPAKAVEKLLGVDLPEDAIQQIVQGVKAKLSAGKLSDTVDPLKNSFDKRDASPKWGARPFLRVR